MQPGDLKQPTEEVWAWLGEVPDPEIPTVSVVDLGIVRDVRWVGETLEIALTPTYSGCPATTAITSDVKSAAQRNGHENVRVRLELSPPWTTDWLTEKGKAALEATGIAPPSATGRPATCPRCQSSLVTKVSQFGSTPCKAMWKCEDCKEPFEYFKCL